MIPPNAPPKRRRIPKATALARGRLAEERVLKACRSDSRPKWILTARFSCHAEDHAGIDIVLETDIGRLFLQVKSSRFGRERFQEVKRKDRIAVVVVKPGDNDEAVLAKVSSALGELRAQYKRERPAFWAGIYGWKVAPK